MTGIKLASVSLLVGLVLAGCGGSQAPTSASPAPLVPAKSLVYLELTVRPQGSQLAEAESALTKLIGHSPDGGLQTAVSKLLRQVGLSYNKDVAPWLGQKVGLVLTAFGRSGLGLIAPTNDTSAALHALKKALGAGASKSYAGAHYQLGSVNGAPVAVGIVGQNAVVAAPSVFRGIVDAYDGHSLAQSQSFASAFAPLPTNALIKGYVNASALGSILRSHVASLPSAGAAAAPTRRVITGALGSLKGAFGFSFTAAANSLSIDLRSTATHPGSPGDVAGLPGQSWLAIASMFHPTGITSLFAALAHDPGFAAFLSHFKSRVGLDLIHDILPALGPFDLSIQGTSALTLGVGLVLKPSDAAAAGRVLAAIRQRVARSKSLVVHGSTRHFTITKPGLPIPRIVVAQTRRRVLATVDESFQQFLSPSSHLASSPRFTSALAQLPAGSKVSVFIDFNALSQLLGSLGSLISSSGDQKALGVLQRLDYVVLGSVPASGQARLVLGLR